MPKLNQRGVVHLLLPLILIIGIVGGIWLITSGPLKLFPRASVSGPIGPTSGFILTSQASTFKVGDKVPVKLLVRSDVTASNLFSAKINFDKDLLVVESIDYSSSIVNNWVEQYFDNATGAISLVGGVPSPGIQTNSNNAPYLMAVVNFKALKIGSTSIAFSNDSEIYSNSTNTNILVSKPSLGLSVVSDIVLAPSSLPVSSVAPSPVTQVTPSPSPALSKPDLTVALTALAPTGVGNSAPMSNAIKITATVTNVGPGNASSSVLSLNVAPGSKPAWRLGVLPLASGQSQQLIVNDLVSLGEYIYTALADADSAVAESKEDNNVDTQTVNIVSPSPVPQIGSGDANGDSKINLVDLSMLLSDFNKTSGFRKGIDLNGDGVINTFDFVLLRNILIQKGVIKG